jgi:hypothetical protein
MSDIPEVGRLYPPYKPADPEDEDYEPMGVNADAELSYGIVFDEGTEFPWEAEPYNGDEDEWWMAVNGYVCPHPSPFTEAGNYKPGITFGSPEVDVYFDHQRKWRELNPFPVTIVNYCSNDYPLHLLTAGPHWRARRGYPVKISPDNMLAVTEEAHNSLLAFCEQYGINVEAEPCWCLSSHWYRQ